MSTTSSHPGPPAFRPRAFDVVVERTGPRRVLPVATGLNRASARQLRAHLEQGIGVHAPDSDARVRILGANALHPAPAAGTRP